MVARQTIPEFDILTVEQAEHWVAATLAQAKALRQYDDQLYPRDEETLATSRRLHEAWAVWADAAEVLDDRVRPILRARRHVDGADDLAYAIGRARAMLTITPESYLAGVDEIRRGDVVNMEEVRREFRDRVQQRRAANH